jgi:hypothetical protein
MPSTSPKTSNKTSNISSNTILQLVPKYLEFHRNFSSQSASPAPMGLFTRCNVFNRLANGLSTERRIGFV